MSYPLYVAFIWHQHQPLYKSYLDGEYRLPWVRLHGTKDYLDLVLLLEQFPRLHQTVNLVPSLLLQIEDYVAGTAFDPYLSAALTPTEALQIGQKQFIVEHFFDAHHRTMIDPHPRYAELYEQQQHNGKAWCLEHWSLQDYSDLLAWHNLAWFDPLFWQDAEIACWLEQGKNFTLSDRQRIYSKQREILSRIIPQHRRMQENGQLEVTTTPYTHPILPLLADTNAGRVAVPQMTLPTQRFQWPEDIPRHLRKAKHLYRNWFGCNPKGLWPSEQSVSPAILPDIAEQGFQWICSDEAVLGWTLQHFFHRDAMGTVMEPELLYRPYRLETPHGDLAIVFRDHRISDLIGFTYGNMPPRQAAIDLVGQLEAISRTLKSRQSGGVALDRPWLVTIALDGENCWEYYTLDGKPFLESLYQILSEHPSIQLVTVSEYLDKFPPTETLPSHQLHSGSWVDGSFTTWIGDPVKNRAWDLLTEARKTLDACPEATEENNPEAWEALYAAEGSDWFWWFGAGHSSNQDAMFDQLFREHLMTLYRALNKPVPDSVRRPVDDRIIPADCRPSGFIHPVIDGQADPQDWDRAGRIEVGGSRGTMHQSTAIQRLWYGVDHLNLYLRVDFKTGAKPGVSLPSELHLFWFYPDRPVAISPIPLENLPNTAPLNYSYHHHLGINLMTQSAWLQEAVESNQWHSRMTRANVAFGDCLEVSIPWADLSTVEPDWSLRLLVILANNGSYQNHVPNDTLIPVDVP
ncbi:glycoside hydrolase [Thermocoleostomius sinensis]|uniref:Glycoside hydrolase n=1 Tax=Thermocoleostomius sinensis A174 TaxID=2016057 RepID=A0A9E8Z9Q6_9CYAN|nr:glycoside hydrolase [Thermocoleostomius sinensis]WAL58911.1 glycoside hydrolase [Thermocoleostomius sinensis A174]